jgi:hypothetical protein
MRRWLYSKHYIRKFLSATLAAGGLGKPSLDLVEAIAMAAMLRDRPKANLRKFRGYSSDCQNQKYEAISE